jgi:hypothetical protein
VPFARDRPKRHASFLTPIGESCVQERLFNRPDDPRRAALMRTLDRLNQRYGRDTVTFAVSCRRPWNMQRDQFSPCYTTMWDESLRVHRNTARERSTMISLLISLMIVGLVTAGIFYCAKGELEDAAQIAHVIEGMAVLGALLFAGLEYWGHFQADEARKREAATAILSKSFDPRYVDDALGNLARKYDPDYKATMAENKFDDDTGSLMSYYWTIGDCVKADLCSLEVVQKMYCFDYKKYRTAFTRIHGEKKAHDDFDELDLLYRCP